MSQKQSKKATKKVALKASKKKVVPFNSLTDNTKEESDFAKKTRAQYAPGIDKCETDWKKRLLIFTPSRGMVRMEWVQSRYGQVVPTNWSHVEMRQFIHPYVPIDYQLGDAQNLMAKMVVEGDYDWVLYIEDDNVLPPNAFWKINDYINKAEEPVVSALYFTKSSPAEPLIYRGRGNSYYRDWVIGEKVRCDGIPFGFRLEHASLIKAAWEESPEYIVNGEKTRRVFESPNSMWYDYKSGGVVAKQGTTDLAWCTRIIKDNLLEKAGWPKHQKMEYPFLVDTSIYVKHITNDGVMYPREFPKEYLPRDTQENLLQAIKILKWEI